MKSICIFGVFVADLCFVGSKIPIKGQTILGNNHIVGPGGKGSNQAIGLLVLRKINEYRAVEKLPLPPPVVLKG